MEYACLEDCTRKVDIIRVGERWERERERDGERRGRENERENRPM